ATRPGSGLLSTWLAAASPAGAAALRSRTFSSLLRRHCRHQCRPRIAAACPWGPVAAGPHGPAFIADDGGPTAALARCPSAVDTVWAPQTAAALVGGSTLRLATTHLELSIARPPARCLGRVR